MAKVGHAPMIARRAISRQAEIARDAYLSMLATGHPDCMGTPTDIGRAIDRLRIRAGVSKKELAAATGIDGGNLNRIISGKQWPGPERLEALAAFFRVPVWEMFRVAEQGLTGQEKEEDPRKGRLKALVDQLDPSQLDTLFRRQHHVVCEPEAPEYPLALTADTPPKKR